MNGRVRVATPYTASTDDPLTLRAGDEVKVGRRDDEWPAWVWCETDDGRSGWVPESYLAREAPEFDRGSVLHDYDATELTVSEGDMLDLLASESGWLWCRAPDGRIGWVPERDVEPA